MIWVLIVTMVAAGQPIAVSGEFRTSAECEFVRHHLEKSNKAHGAKGYCLRVKGQA